MNGDIHQPPFLTIYWGEMQFGLSISSSNFKCRLSWVKVKYTLFTREGLPLRAILFTEFVADVDDKKRMHLEKKNSPDLTHTRIVTSGSNLPLLAQQIYQDPLLYIKVAQDNKLDNLREIAPGTILHFSPIVNDGINRTV
jgi:hypothetical protein